MIQTSNAFSFKKITLEEMESVELMNRIDTKFCIHYKHLPFLLKSISSHYYALEIDGNQLMPYKTVYFDTEDKSLYKAHHNEKLNRIKLRRRTYLNTETSFFEIKKKTNKGRTIKYRILTEHKNEKLVPNEAKFLEQNSKLDPHSLAPSLTNTFNRLTLVNKNERCTIDSNIQFKNNNTTMHLEGIIIVEVKTEGKPKNSKIIETLKKQKHKPASFSKYCIGMLKTNTNLKYNRFKSQLLKLEAISNS